MVLCGRGDLWLDEIWSFEWVERAASHWDILSRFHHDNNHPLNTWWMMMIGLGRPPLLYRALAVACGITSLFLLGRLAAAIVPSARGIATMLGALSFPLVLYFSEARGYAPAVACSLAAAVILAECPVRPSFLQVLLFWLVCMVGMLSHATFLLAMTAIAIWKSVRIVEEVRAPAKVLFAAAFWFAIPAAAALALYAGFLRGMEIGGGPEFSCLTVVGQFFGYALGWPVDGEWWKIAAIVAGSILFLLGVLFGMRNSQIPRIRWLFLLLPFPAVIVLVFTHPEVLYFRYFLVFLPFFYLAMGVLLTRFLGSPAWPLKIGAVLFLGVYAVLQFPRLFDLALHGRGEYRQALRLVAASPFANKAVTSDHDPRNKALVEFFTRNDPLCSSVRYVRLSNAGTDRVGWLIRHTQEPIREKPAQFMHSPTGTYRFVAVFPYSGVSGWNWLLYRAEPSTPFMTKMSQGGSPAIR